MTRSRTARSRSSKLLSSPATSPPITKHPPSSSLASAASASFPVRCTATRSSRPPNRSNPKPNPNVASCRSVQPSTVVGACMPTCRSTKAQWSSKRSSPSTTTCSPKHPTMPNASRSPGPTRSSPSPKDHSRPTTPRLPGSHRFMIHAHLEADPANPTGAGAGVAAPRQPAAERAPPIPDARRARPADLRTTRPARERRPHDADRARAHPPSRRAPRRGLRGPGMQCHPIPPDPPHRALGRWRRKRHREPRRTLPTTSSVASSRRAPDQRRRRSNPRRPRRSALRRRARPTDRTERHTATTRRAPTRTALQAPVRRAPRPTRRHPRTQSRRLTLVATLRPP